MAAYLSASHWLVTVPNVSGSEKATFDRFNSAMIEKAGRPVADLSVFKVPMMKVGTLDSLMALSDDLARADSTIESVVKKVERQVAESYNALKVAELQKKQSANDGPVSIPPLGLRCGGKPVHEYVANFRWDAEQWDAKESLPDLVKRLVAGADKIDSDVRSYAQAYQEKKTALQAAERKRSGNLMVTALEDVITPDALKRAGAEWIGPDSSEFLASVAVVVPKVGEEAFLESYPALDAEAVPMGPEGRRDAVRGSPVVPGSARKIAEDKDGYVLYALVILKRFADSFRTACREKRLSVREFTYDPAAAGGGAKAAAGLATEVAATLDALKDASRRQFQEALALWMHLKAVRAFVESVLRYGLPVNFTALLFKVHRGPGIAGRLVHAVQAAWADTMTGRSVFDEAYAPVEKGEAPDPVIAGITDAGAASFPFVLLDFDVRVDTAAQATK